MATHDIIDNRSEKLVDHINQILGSTDCGRFAVGYFFLSGLESIARSLASVKELRLLIGNTTNRETLEQLAEGYRRLELVSEAAEAQSFPKKTETKRMATVTADNIRATVELMDQTDDAEATVKILVRLIEEKRLKVRLYTKGRMHAKAYIFTYGEVYDLLGNKVERHEKGLAIVGSSNLTLSGVSHNTELNVMVQGNTNHDELVRWFDELWAESQDFDETLMNEMQQSWAIAPVRPYDIYMKTLHALVKDRLEDEEDRDILWDDEITRKLANFQKVAVRQAVQIIRDYRGAFVADVVGLGKSFIGAAIVKHFERTDHARPLILCPAPLKEMWENYNETYQLNANVLSIGYLFESTEGSGNLLLDSPKYKDRDFILVDESHNFRYTGTQRYKLLQDYMAANPSRRCCLLTATPRNKSAWDVYSQIKLFHQDDKTDLPVDPPDLKQYFKFIEKGDRKLPDLLAYILIRRTRNHILRWYGFDSETNQPVDPSRFQDYLEGRRRAYVEVAGKHQFFPKRHLETITYSIEDTYQGLYQELRGYLGKPLKEANNGKPPKQPANQLTFARYGLFRYVKEDKRKKEPYASLHRAGANLHGLIRVLLFKRFESSVYAFKQTIGRLLTTHESFLKSLEAGFVPAGEEAQAILYDPSAQEEADLLTELKRVSTRYQSDDFNLDQLRDHIQHDIAIFQRMLALVEPITPEKDAKLQVLLKRLKEQPLSDGKRLIFTQYADTARYLFDYINPGGADEEIEVIFSGDKSKFRVVGRFSPNSNPEYQWGPNDVELDTVIATDVLSEGLNLQDCDKIVNYDLHWNPVRLIQRFGRIDRIGSEHDSVYGFNFLPETGIEKNLKLQEKLARRIAEIHETIGEDSAILDPAEQLNENAMYAIYEKRDDAILSLFEDEDELVDLNEAEEILRQLKKDNPGEYDRIAALRDGIRTSKPALNRGMYVFCQADRYQQLFLLDEKGNVISRDIPKVLGMIKCGPDLPGQGLPAGYNSSVMKVKRLFTEEVKHRQAQKDHTLSLSHGQRYALKELRIYFGTVEDEEAKADINLLERAFRLTGFTRAVRDELNKLRRNNLTGPNLFKSLVRLYQQHNLRDWLDRPRNEVETPIPKIICSEALR
jgi:superfamily II DNA or RNA helicase